EAQPLMRRQQGFAAAVGKTQAQAFAVQQHQFAFDAGEGRERRVLLDLGDGQAQLPLALYRQAQYLAGPAQPVAPTLSTIVGSGNDAGGEAQDFHRGMMRLPRHACRSDASRDGLYRESPPRLASLLRITLASRDFPSSAACPRAAWSRSPH